MPRMTAKYKGALAVAGKVLKYTQPLPANQEELYDTLQHAGWFWDSDAGCWEYHDATEADPPTPLVHIRVWAGLDSVKSAADVVIKTVTAKKLKLVERSKIYPCRPPKQLEGRIYLKFMPA